MRALYLFVFSVAHCIKYVPIKVSNNFVDREKEREREREAEGAREGESQRDAHTHVPRPPVLSNESKPRAYPKD